MLSAGVLCWRAIGGAPPVGMVTSVLLQVSLKERLQTRYQQTSESATGPAPLPRPGGAFSESLTGLGSSTMGAQTDRHTDGQTDRGGRGTDRDEEGAGHRQQERGRTTDKKRRRDKQTVRKEGIGTNREREERNKQTV